MLPQVYAVNLPLTPPWQSSGPFTSVMYALDKGQRQDLWRFLDVVAEVTLIPRKCLENS